MLKTKELFDTMYQEYCSIKNPEIELGTIGNKTSESYELQYVAGKIRLHAENPFGAIIGWNRAITTVESGYIRENIGHQSPRFPIRAFQGSTRDIPKAIKQGYNAVVRESGDELASFHEYGLKVILKLKEPHEDLNWDSLYAIWVHSSLDDDEYKTRLEMIEEDLARWEKWVNQRGQLIYQLSHGMDECLLLNLCVKAQKGTTLAFPASCTANLWEKFRQNLDLIHTPLLVIMDQEGDLIEKMVGHNFCGGVSLNYKPHFFLN